MGEANLGLYSPVRGKMNSSCTVDGVALEIGTPTLLMGFGGCDENMIAFVSPPCNEMSRTLSVLELSLVTPPAP